MKDVVLTKEGYQALKREIDDLSTRRRREVAERIKIAREFGDIAENAEYDAAKNDRRCWKRASRSSRSVSRPRV